MAFTLSRSSSSEAERRRQERLAAEHRKQESLKEKPAENPSTSATASTKGPEGRSSESSKNSDRSNAQSDRSAQSIAKFIAQKVVDTYHNIKKDQETKSNKYSSKDQPSAGRSDAPDSQSTVRKGMSFSRRKRSKLSVPTAAIPCLTSGSRPIGFIRSWKSKEKQDEHFEKHVVTQKEFNHPSPAVHSEEAFSFWEKSLINERGEAAILEKTGKNRNLYRFEPSTGILGIATIDKETGKPVQVTYFKPKLYIEGSNFTAKNPTFLKDALEYFHGQ